MRVPTITITAAALAAWAVVLCGQESSPAADRTQPAAAQTATGSLSKMSIEKSVLGQTPEGVEVELFTLANNHEIGRASCRERV